MKKRVSIVSSIVFLGVFVFSTFVNADTWGWKWSSNIATISSHGALILKYWKLDSVTNSYNWSIIDAGANKWNLATGGSQINFVGTSSINYSNVDIAGFSQSDFNNNGWGTSTRAWTQTFKYTSSSAVSCGTSPVVHNCGSGDTIIYAQILVNNDYVYASDTYKKALFAHELGHAAGLGHSSYLNGTIMDSTLSNGTDVTAIDLQFANNMYPYH